MTKQVGVFNANTLGLLNRVASLGQGQASRTLAELVGNSIDAGAATIHIVLVDGIEGKKIILADDGHGILGWVPDDQTQVIAEYVGGSNSLQEQIADAAIEKLFRELNPVYAISFLYMLSSGALSAKSRPQFWSQAQSIVKDLWSTRKRSAESPQGTFGIGMTEAWTLGQCYYTSRPFLGLAQAGYGPEFKRQDQVPIYRMIAPRFGFDAETRSRNFSIEEVTPKYKNGFRIPYVNVALEHGTVVEITDIDARISEQHISDYLSALYGGLIYKGDIRILMYNVTVTKTMTKFNPIPKELESIKLIGRPIFEVSPLVIETEYQGLPYQAVIYLNSVGKDGQPFPPSFVRRGVKKDPVTSIADYFPEIWGNQQLTGLVEILTPADLVPLQYSESDQKFWDPKKDKPNIAHPGIALLLEQVSGLTEYITSVIGEIKQSRKANRASTMSEAVARALQRTITRFGDFFNLDTPPQPGVTKMDTEGAHGDSSGGSTNPVLPGISVLVFNEHGEFSTAQVRVRVLDEKSRLVQQRDFKGHLNLDPVQNRQKYKIYLDLPPGVSFAVGVNNPTLAYISPKDHVTIRFDIISGEEKRLRRKLRSGLSVVFSPAGQESGAWSLQHLEQGQIWINTDYAPLALAMDRGDAEGCGYIVGHAIAAALSIAAFVQVDQMVMVRQFELGNTLAVSIAEEWQGNIE